MLAQTEAYYAAGHCLYEYEEDVNDKDCTYFIFFWAALARLRLIASRNLNIVLICDQLLAVGTIQSKRVKNSVSERWSQTD